MGLFSKLFGPQPAGPGHTSGKRILVVDDSITIQKVIELRLPGHELHSAQKCRRGRSSHSTRRRRRAPTPCSRNRSSLRRSSAKSNDFSPKDVMSNLQSHLVLHMGMCRMNGWLRISRSTIGYCRKHRGSAVSTRRRRPSLKRWRSTSSVASRRRFWSCSEQSTSIRATTTRNSDVRHEGVGGYAGLVPCVTP